MLLSRFELRTSKVEVLNSSSIHYTTVKSLKNYFNFTEIDNPENSERPTKSLRYSQKCWYSRKGPLFLHPYPFYANPDSDSLQLGLIFFPCGSRSPPILPSPINLLFGSCLNLEF